MNSTILLFLIFFILWFVMGIILGIIYLYNIPNNITYTQYPKLLVMFGLFGPLSVLAG